MTENKRFIINDGIVTDKIDLSMYMDNEDCCEKLNELHEENNHLEEHLNIVRSHRDILISKNKELKEQVRLLNIEDERWTKASEEDKETIDRLNKENNELYILVETLKNQNQKFKARLNDLGVEYL